MTPELSIIVASDQRPLRLRWLLNALEAQTLEQGAWETIVCHPAGDVESAAVLRDHPLAGRGGLRAVASHNPGAGA